MYCGNWHILKTCRHSVKVNVNERFMIVWFQVIDLIQYLEYFKTWDTIGSGTVLFRQTSEYILSRKYFPFECIISDTNVVSFLQQWQLLTTLSHWTKCVKVLKTCIVILPVISANVHESHQGIHMHLSAYSPHNIVWFSNWSTCIKANSQKSGAPVCVSFQFIM